MEGEKESFVEIYERQKALTVAEAGTAGEMAFSKYIGAPVVALVYTVLIRCGFEDSGQAEKPN